MLQLLRRVLLLITVLALCVGAVRVGYGLVYPMEAAGVFAMSACELPCWMGLEVGVTDYDEALMVAETFEDLDLEIYPRFTVKDDLEGLMFFLSGTISSF
ncbi:MAG: hypothetical protein AAFR56_20145, partial [Chloroflexota bacterium]